MDQLGIGSYVQYRGEWFLACNFVEDLVTILKPNSNAKLQVHKRNLTVSKHVALFVWGKDDRGYLITNKTREVVSLTTNRWVSTKWFYETVCPEL